MSSLSLEASLFTKTGVFCGSWQWTLTAASSAQSATSSVVEVMSASGYETTEPNLFIKIAAAAVAATVAAASPVEVG